MKKLTLLLFILAGLSSYAQQQYETSKIILKDGSELNVLIIANVPGEYIIVNIPGNDNATISYDKILSIKQKNFKYFTKYTPTKKQYWDASFAFAFGMSSDSGGPRIGFELGTTYNYRISPLLSAGAGAETMAFFVNNETIFIPVFARLKGLLNESRVTGFYAMDYGYSFALKTAINEANKVEGGWFARPTIGLQTGNFSLGIGYQLQKVTTTSENTWWLWTNNSKVIEERLMRNIVFVSSLSF